MFWNYAPAKEAIREFVLPESHVRHGIWMPADTCLCVNKAFEMGLLKFAKRVLLVEKDRAIYERMEKSAPKIKSVCCVLGLLEEQELEHPVDYAFLDYLGGMSRPVSLWMSDVLSPRLVEGSTVAITQIMNCRGSNLIPEQLQILENSVVQRKEIKRRYGVRDKRMQCFLLLLHRIFRQWDFGLLPSPSGPWYDLSFRIPKYQDAVNPMIVFKLVGFKRLKTPLFQPL